MYLRSLMAAKAEALKQNLWEDLERDILYYRSNTAMIVQFFQALIAIMFGYTEMQQAEKIMSRYSNGSFYNEQMAEILFPIAKWGYLTG